MTTETFIAIIGAVGGVNAIIELVRFFLTRKASQRQALAAAQHATAEADDKWFAKYEHQLDRMNTQIEFKDRRIEDLNTENAEKEKRYIEQTKRLRESQDNEHKSQLEINRLNGILIENEQRIAQLELLLKDVKCHRLTCLDREPKNDYTRQAEAEAQSGAPIEKLKQTTHRKKTKGHEDTENSD